MSGKTEKAALEQRIYDRCLVRVGQLEAENAKLRELASVLRRCLGGCLNGEDCENDCPMLDADGWCNRDNRLREFGIEVEDQ